MAREAKMVVPPVAVAQITGVYAVQITARKLHLLDSVGKSIRSRTYNRTHNIASKSFMDLVAFVREGQGAPV